MIKSIKILVQKFRKGVSWLVSQQGTPANQAKGLAAGIFWGCFPLFGFQTLLGICFASLLRGNRILAAIGTWVSNPFTYLPLYWFNYQIGFGVLKINTDLSSYGQRMNSSLWGNGWEISIRILLGSTIVGSLLGITVGVMYYLLLKKILNRKKLNQIFQMRDISRDLLE